MQVNIPYMDPVGHYILLLMFCITVYTADASENVHRIYETK